MEKKLDCFSACLYLAGIEEKEEPLTDRNGNKIKVGAIRTLYCFLMLGELAMSTL